MRLFHFSEEGDIARFVPRPVAVPAVRAPGMAWLNGPLVWAIDAWHQPMYLFPRDCPRVLVWPVATSTADDLRAYCAESDGRMTAYVETGWLDRVRDTILYRYTLPGDGFRSLDDAGMWVSDTAVSPLTVEAIADLPGALAAAGVVLRTLPSLAPLAALRTTSLHVSAIRLRNARA